MFVLNSEVAVKVGNVNSVDTYHLVTLEYIQASAPVIGAPRTCGLVKSKHNAYLFMSRMHGDSLDHLWPKLNRDEKESIQRQLNIILRALRSVPEPPKESGQSALGCGNHRGGRDLRGVIELPTTGFLISRSLMISSFQALGRRQTIWISSYCDNFCVLTIRW